MSSEENEKFTDPCLLKGGFAALSYRPLPVQRGCCVLNELVMAAIPEIGLTERMDRFWHCGPRFLMGGLPKFHTVQNF